MSSADPAPVGAMLRAAREKCGLSVTDIAERTRIRATLVREIEVDDFSGCGDPFYARGHVRSIALTVGLDPSPVLQHFDASTGAAPPAVPAQTLPAYDPVRARPRAKKRDVGRVQRSGPNWTAAMIVAASLVALFAVATFFGVLRGQHRPSANVGALPSPTTAKAKPKPETSPSSAVAQVPQSGVNLRIRVVDGASWIRVTDAAGREAFQGVLRGGAVKDFRDPKLLTARYGNTRAVSVVLNGKDLGSPSCGSIVCSERYEAEQAAG